jgi:asparagine synthase (glutamine-hydrolysing)
MCGIAGILDWRGMVNPGFSPGLHQLKAMSHALRHRGPDGEGYLQRPALGLAHTRLSIIDLAGGQQPIFNEDGSIAVVFNGEIFNYLELRNMLQGQGHRFSTQSDTEVIVHLYEQFGQQFVEHLNGQFAIALWDERQQTLLLLRDRVGITPLFYRLGQQGGSPSSPGERVMPQLAFASEIKAIQAIWPEAARPDLQALDQIMTCWSPVGARTLFEGVHALEPGTMLVAQRGPDHTLRHEVQRYWDWSFPESPDGYHAGSDEDLFEQLRALLVDATRIRLRADVPVGAYLSGGLDSSILASLIRHESSSPLRTFSIGFDSPEHDETQHQNRMVDFLGTEHSRITCSSDAVGRQFMSTIWHAETAMLRTAPAPMMALSGLVREQGYKVVLTGEGADEVFGGYDLFKEAKVRRFWARQPQSRARPLLLQRLYPYLDQNPAKAQSYLERFYGVGLDAPHAPAFSHQPRLASTSQTRMFLAQPRPDGEAAQALADLLPAQAARWSGLARAQYIESRLLMGNYLLCSQGDRMLMANSVEGRFPFLDHRLIDFASRLPDRLKIRALNEKWVLKRAMRRYLPNDAARTKQPYRAPDAAAFIDARTGQAQEWVADLLSPSRLADTGYFNPKMGEMLLKKAVRGPATLGSRDNQALVAMVSMQAWHHHFIDQKTGPGGQAPSE